MKKIAAVVVTYNRKEELKKNIDCLLNQTRKPNKIYVIDNCSSDGTYELFKKNKNNHIEYIRLNENLGGAGGFFVGLKKAYDDGYDYIWGMDDDAFPSENALKELECAIEYFDENTCFWSNCDNDIFFDGNYKTVNSWMFVGFFISRKVIEKVGLPRSDFFIYHDDDEYAYRIIKNGFNIVKVKHSIIKHGNFNTRKKYYRKIIGRIIEFPYMPEWKFYYYIRNYLLKYKWSDINKYKVLFYYLPKIYLKLIILDIPQRSIFFKALWHGLTNKTGKVEKP